MKFDCKKIEPKIKQILFYISLFVLIYAFGIVFNTIDYDIFARLIMGKGLIETHSVIQDIFSYTPTHVWYDPEWLTSAFFYLVLKYFHLKGIILLKIVLIYLIIVSINFAIKNTAKNENPNNIGIYLAIIVMFLQNGYLVHTIRCQLIGFIFLSFWIMILEKARQNKNKYLYFAPLLMLLWLNCHGSAISAIGILMIYAFGEFLNKKPYKKYLLTLLFCAIAFLINPWGINYIKFIFDSAFLNRAWIAEWAPTIFFRVKLFILYLILIISSQIFYDFKHKINFKNIDKTKYILLFTTGYLSLAHIKHSALLIILGTILCYEQIYYLYNYLMEKLRNYLQIESKTVNNLKKIKEILTYSIILIYSISTIILFPIEKNCLKNFPNNFPLYPMEFLKVNNIKGKILSNFACGSFIAYKYYPDYKIYMDGRQEQVYSLETFDKLMFFLNQFGAKPDIILEKYHPDIILLEKNIRATRKMEKNDQYIKIYSDNMYYIYVLKNLQKFSYIPINKDKSKYLENIFKTNLDFKSLIMSEGEK